MIRRRFAAWGFAALAATAAAQAQDGQPVPVPVVTVSASATTTVPNDRLHAWLRAEAENVSAVAAAADVNARVARVLAKLKALPGAQVSTSGYTSQQIVEKGKPARWRIVQTIKVEGTDFAAIGDTAARLQAEDGVLLSGISFGISDELRRRTQDAITEQAIAAWRSRAQGAAQGFGIAGWRPGRVTIQAGDPIRPYPMYARADAQMAASPAPVPLEAGSTEVSVTVSGEAILDPARPLAR
jgi:predicted secreted protein